MEPVPLNLFPPPQIPVAVLQPSAPIQQPQVPLIQTKLKQLSSAQVELIATNSKKTIDELSDDLNKQLCEEIRSLIWDQEHYEVIPLFADQLEDDRFINCFVMIPRKERYNIILGLSPENQSEIVHRLIEWNDTTTLYPILLKHPNVFVELFPEMTDRQKIAFLIHMAEHNVQDPLLSQAQELLLKEKGPSLANLNLIKFFQDFRKDPFMAPYRHFVRYGPVQANTFFDNFNEDDSLPESDLKILAHIFGDSFVTDHELEGLEMGKAISVFQNYFQKICADEPELLTRMGVKNKRSLDKLTSCAMKLSNLKSSYINKPQDDFRQEFQKFIDELIAELRTDGWIALPSGWCGLGGHFNCMEIHREGNECNIKLFETGFTNLHKNKWHNDKQKQEPFIVIPQIRPNLIENQTFFQIIFGLEIFEQDKSKVRYNENDLYGFLLTLFERGLRPSFSLIDNWPTVQRSGICSWKGLMLYLRMLLPRIDYWRVKHKIKLISLAKTPDSAFALDGYTFFFKSISRKFAKHSLKLFEKGILSQTELALAYHILIEKNRSLRKVNPFTRNFVITAPSNDNDLSKVFTRNRVQNPYHITQPCSLSFLSSYNLVLQLSEISTVISKLRSQKRISEMKFVICSLIENLPDANCELPTLSIEIASELSKIVYFISDLYNFECSHENEALDFFYRTSLYVLQYKLASCLMDIEFSVPYTHLTKKTFTTLLRYVEGDFRLNLQIRELLNYIEKNFTIPWIAQSTDKRPMLIFSDLAEDKDPKVKLIRDWWNAKGLVNEDGFEVFYRIFQKQSVLPKAFWNLWNQYFLLFCVGSWFSPKTYKHVVIKQTSDKITSSIYSETNSSIYLKWNYSSVKTKKLSGTDALTFARIPAYLSYYTNHLFLLLKGTERKKLETALFKNFSPGEESCSLEYELLHGEKELVSEKLKELIIGLQELARAHQCYETYIYTFQLAINVSEMGYSLNVRTNFVRLIDLGELVTFYGKSQGVAQLNLGHTLIKYYIYLSLETDRLFATIAIESLFKAFLLKESTNNIYFQLFHELEPYRDDLREIIENFNEEERSNLIRTLFSINNRTYQNETYHFNWPQIHLSGVILDLHVGQFFNINNTHYVAFSKDLHDIPGVKEALGDKKPPELILRNQNQFQIPETGITIDKTFLPAQVTVNSEVIEEKFNRRHIQYEIPKNRNFHFINPNQLEQDKPIIEILTRLKDVPFWKCGRGQEYWNSKFELWIDENHEFLLLFEIKSRRVIEIRLTEITPKITDLISRSEIKKISLEDESHLPFFKIEDSDRVIFWSTRSATKVELLSYGLTFTNTDDLNNEFISVDFPGYEIEEIEHSRFFDELPLIWLKNGNKHLLIVSQRLLNFTSECISTSSSIPASDKEIPWYTLTQTVDEGTESLDFEAGFNGEDHHLAHFIHSLLTIHQFELALKYVRRISKNVADEKLLNQLEISFQDTSFLYAGHPHLLALQLHIGCIMINIDTNRCLISKNDFRERLKGVYLDYLLKLTNVGSQFLLSTENELTICNVLEGTPHMGAAFLLRKEKLTQCSIGIPEVIPKENPTETATLDLLTVISLPYTPIPDLFRIDKNHFRPSVKLEHNFYYLLHQLILARTLAAHDKIIAIIHLICCHKIADTAFSDKTQQSYQLAHFLIKIAHTPIANCNFPVLDNQEPKVIHQTLIEWVTQNHAKFTKASTPPSSATSRVMSVAIPQEQILTQPLEISPTKRKSDLPIECSHKASKKEKESDPSYPFKALLVKYFKPDALEQLSVRVTCPEHHPLFQNSVVQLIINHLNRLAAQVLVVPTWQMKELPTLPHLQRSVQRKTESCQNESKQILQKILDFFKPTPESDKAIFFSKLKTHMQEMAGDIPELDLIYCLNLYLERDDIIPELKALIERFIYTTLVSRLGNQISKLLKENPNQEQVAELMQSCVPTFESDDLLHRVKSYFEMIAYKHLRSKQWSLFQECEKHEKIAFQSPCGSGKTLVMTPLLTLFHRVEGAVINIVPRDNLETNYTNLRNFFGRYNPRQVRLFQFNRRTSLDDKHLNKLVEDFAASQSKGDLIVGDPQSFQSLELKYFESLVFLSTGRQNSENILQKLESIISCWMNSKTLLDELQICLKPLHYLNYTVGNQIDVESYRWNIAYLLHHFMITLNSQGHRFPLDNDLKRGWTTDHYLNVQRPALIQHVAKALMPNESHMMERYLSADRNTISHEERDVLTHWLNCKTYIVQKELMLLRSHINFYLPRALSGQCFVYYGPSKSNEFACKYTHNMKPADDTTFENIDGLIDYTIHMFLNTGLSKEQMMKMLTGWQIQAHQKLQPTALQLHFKETFSEIPIHLMNLSDNDLFESVFQSFSKHPDFIFEYLNEYVFPQLRQYEYKLSSSPHDLADILFPKMTAFSGTLLSNYLTLPQNMSVQFDEQADAEILSLILGGTSCVIEVVDSISLDRVVENPNVCMLLDPGAYFQGKTNLQVAQEILDLSPEYLDGVNYFNEVNLLTLLKRPGLPLGKELNVLTYCDQEHTSGTDTVQPSNGIAILAISDHLTLTELTQAIKRMRKVGKGQIVKIRIDKELQKTILLRMGEEMLNPEIFILWCLLNESKTISDTLLVSFRQQLHAIYRRALLLQIIDLRNHHPVDLHLIRSNLVQRNKGLLLDVIDQEEFIQHASLEAPQTPLAAFESQLAFYRQSYPDLLSVKDAQQLKTLHQKASLYLNLTPEQQRVDNLNVSVQIEQQAFKDVQSQIQDRIKAFAYKEWDPVTLLESPYFKSFLSEDSEGIYYTDYLSLHRLRGLTALGIDTNIYTTNNALYTAPFPPNSLLIDKIEDIRKHLPKFEYILSIDAIGKRKYILVSENDFNTLRKSLLMHFDKSRKDVNLSMYTIDGDRWMTCNNPDDPLIQRISAQVKFLNCQTKYSLNQRAALTEWLREDATMEKVNFFFSSYQKKGIEHKIESRYQNSDLSQIIEQL